jgi:hypothetical protein
MGIEYENYLSVGVPYMCEMGYFEGSFDKINI